MVQYIQRKPSLAEMLGQNIVGGLGGMFQRERDIADQQRKFAQESGLLQEKANLDLSNLREKERLKTERQNALVNMFFPGEGMPAQGVGMAQPSAGMTQEDIFYPGQQKQPAQSAQPQGSQPQSGQPPGKKRLSPEELLRLGIVNPQLASLMQKQQEAEDKKQQELDKEGRQLNLEKDRTGLTFAQKQLQSIQEDEANLALKESALNTMKNAIEEMPEGFSWDYVAQQVPFLDFLTSPSTAQFLTGAKEFFVGTITGIGGRLNQWIEQRMYSMLPNVGRSKAANYTVIRALENEIDIKRKRSELFNKYYREERNKMGTGTADFESISSRVDKEIKKYQESIQPILYNDLVAIGVLYDQEDFSKNVAQNLGPKGIGKKQPEKVLKNFSKVPKGTPINKNIVDAYKKRNPKASGIEIIDYLESLGYSTDEP